MTRRLLILLFTVWKLPEPTGCARYVGYAIGVLSGLGVLGVLGVLCELGVRSVRSVLGVLSVLDMLSVGCAEWVGCMGMYYVYGIMSLFTCHIHVLYSRPVLGRCSCLHDMIQSILTDQCCFYTDHTRNQYSCTIMSTRYFGCNKLVVLV